MFAKNLENLLAQLCQKDDGAYNPEKEFGERFETLRGYGMLPRGRERRGDPLTNYQIACAVLGMAAKRPGWAGHTAVCLEKLRPAGGVAAGFFDQATFAASIEHILSDAMARESVITVTCSMAEGGMNSSGYGSITYMKDGTPTTAHFVPYSAFRALQPGGEEEFKGRGRYAMMSTETVFNRAFFERLARDVERARIFAERFPAEPEGDGSEYDAEDRKIAWMKEIGAVPSSRFLHIGVDNQVTWPSKPTPVKFDKYRLVLLPKTAEHVQSVHIDLTKNRVTMEQAETIINRFLSVLTWCCDQYAVVEHGWAGNPLPAPVSRKNLAFTTASQWFFDRKIPETAEEQRALALYREARNAEQNAVISYAVLNYYKVIELRHTGKNDVKNWFRDNWDAVKAGSNSDDFTRFLEKCGAEKPHEYIYKACRIATAHAGKHSQSDPDDVLEQQRLHIAARVLRIFARHFIKEELGISDSYFG